MSYVPRICGKIIRVCIERSRAWWSQNAIDNSDKRLLSIRHIIAVLRFFIRVSSENSNYLYCRDDRKGPDYVTFSYRITPDACSSLCLRLSDPTSVPEPLAGIRKERRQERRGVAGREECSLEIRRWKWTAGINNLSNDAAPLSESIFATPLIPARHSQTMVALEAASSTTKW